MKEHMLNSGLTISRTHLKSKECLMINSTNKPSNIKQKFAVHLYLIAEIIRPKEYTSIFTIEFPKASIC